MTTFETHPMAWIIAVGVLIMILVLGIIMTRCKRNEFFAKVQEDLANTYTPDLLKPKPIEKPAEVEAPVKSEDTPKEE